MDDDAAVRKWLESVDPVADFAKAARAAEALAPTLVGLDEAGAQASLEAHNLALRVARRDDVSFPVRADRRPNRINVSIENSTVVSAEVH